jgi:UDPglucose 6-dehydrogenase
VVFGLQKDILNLVYIAKSYAQSRWQDCKQVIIMNDHQKDAFQVILCKHYIIRFQVKKITFLGWAFKKIPMILVNQQRFMLQMI